MIRRTHQLIAALALTASMAGAHNAHASSTFIYNGQTYSGLGSSPFAGTPGLVVENFEHGTINSLISAVGGSIRGPSGSTDSVDGDDGLMDGKGRSGHSYSTSGRSMTFNFHPNGSGNAPSMAGLVWTDGRPNAMVTFRAWDASGHLLGRIQARAGDLMRNGTTGEDRFFGITSDQGISRIRITSSRPGFEVDHVQFAYGFSVVPLPPALGMGILGLAGAAIWRRRFVRSRATDQQT